MSLLWRYDDYVKNLVHPHPLVRRWAFDSIEHRFANRYTDAVIRLIGDEDELLACAALRYLATQGAVQHAPAILETFKAGRGLVAGNCAIALGDLGYEPAGEVLIDYLTTARSSDFSWSIMHYFGKIQCEDHREVLGAVMEQTDDPFDLGGVTENLLRYHHPEDIGRVLGHYFRVTTSNHSGDPILRGLAHALGGGDYFRDLADFGRNGILEKPGRTIEELMAGHPQIRMEGELSRALVQAIAKKQYIDFCTLVAADAARIVDTRYPGTGDRPWLKEASEKDTMSLAALDTFNKHAPIWKKARGSNDFGRLIVSIIISIYFGIKERGPYLTALSPDAGVAELIDALKKAGPRLPLAIRKRIIELAPVAELKGLLTEDRHTWGDTWAVRLMGHIGDKEFAPELVRTLNAADSLSYVYSDAIDAIHALEESADEFLLNAIRDNAMDDWASFAILEQLPYSEAYDLAVQRWSAEGNEPENKMDSYELFACCLRQIGDSRGIEKLQGVYADENDATYIGDALDCLGALHQVDIPELPDILRRRKEHQKSQRERMKLWNNLAYDSSALEAPETFETAGNVVPLTRSAPKTSPQPTLSLRQRQEV
jgi:hypothetical protein